MQCHDHLTTWLMNLLSKWQKKTVKAISHGKIYANLLVYVMWSAYEEVVKVQSNGSALSEIVKILAPPAKEVLEKI